jgi:hypothetical protein
MSNAGKHGRYPPIELDSSQSWLRLSTAEDRSFEFGLSHYGDAPSQIMPGNLTYLDQAG